MTWCEDSFQKFNERIKLDSTRWERVRNAVSHLLTFSQSDEILSLAVKDVFLQGSASYGTIIKPLQTEEYDVDVVIKIDLSKINLSEPDRVLDWFTNRLKEDEFYNKNLVIKDRCIRINYVGDFHLDIVPATDFYQNLIPLAIPARDLSQWVVTDPKGFTKWVIDKSKVSGEYFENNYFFSKVCSNV